MFGTIRRHQQWLWYLIIGVIIISFVVFFAPDLQYGGPSGDVGLGSINGRKLTKEDYFNARKEEFFSFRLSQRRWPNAEDTNFNLERRIRQRMYYIEKLREYNIVVNDEAVAHHMANVFRDPTTGTFSTKSYDEFVKVHLPQGGLVEDDMFRFFRNEVGLRQLIMSVGLSGRMTPPRVAEAYYNLENQQVSGGVAFLSLSNYLNRVVVDTNKLAGFFNSRTNMYRTPKKVQVSYVTFPATNYVREADALLAAETNLSLMINQEYLRGGTNVYKDMTEAAAKESIRSAFRARAMVGMARSNAVQFANVVYSKGNSPGLVELAEVAKINGLTVKETETFAQLDEPKGFIAGDGEEVAEAAFKLSPAQPLSQLVTTTNAVYMLALKNTIDRQEQKFEEVRAKVTDDFRHAEAFELMREAGATLQKKLTEGLPAKSFKAICDEAKITAVDLPLFTADTPNIPGLDDRVQISQLARMASGIPAGKVSNYTPIRDGGMVLYVRERKPPADTAIKLDAYLKDLREARESAAFEEWFSKAFEKSGLAPAQPAGMPGQLQ